MVTMLTTKVGEQQKVIRESQNQYVEEVKSKEARLVQFIMSDVLEDGGFGAPWNLVLQASRGYPVCLYANVLKKEAVSASTAQPANSRKRFHLRPVCNMFLPDV